MWRDIEIFCSFECHNIPGKSFSTDKHQTGNSTNMSFKNIECFRRQKHRSKQVQLLETVQITTGRSHFAKEMHTSAGKSALQRVPGHWGPLKRGTWKHNVRYVRKKDVSVRNRSFWPTTANTVIRLWFLF